MAKNRRLAAVAGAISLAGVLVAGPVLAQTGGTAEVYVGSALATALDAKVFGTGLTLGSSKASINSSPQAVADGVGVAGIAGTTTHSEVTGSGNDTKAPACAVPLNLTLVNAGLACGSSTAKIDGGNPSATGKGTVAAITLDASSLTAGVGATLKTLVGTVCQLTGTASPVTTITQTVGGLIGGVNLPLPVTIPVANVLNPDQCNALLQGLITALTDGKLLDVSIGDATASSTADGSNVSSVGDATGATIKVGVMPSATKIQGLVSTDPLVTVTAGAAKATATYSRGSGQTSAAFDPSVVKVRLNLLVAPTTEVSVPVGQSQVILAGTPLESEVIVGAGSTKTNPDGTITAVADGVKVHLLRTLNGGVLLNLAHAEAGVGGTPAAAAPAAAPNAELPRTGGTPWIPLAGVSILGLAVLVRRVLVRAY